MMLKERKNTFLGLSRLCVGYVSFGSFLVIPSLKKCVLGKVFEQDDNHLSQPSNAIVCFFRVYCGFLELVQGVF